MQMEARAMPLRHCNSKRGAQCTTAHLVHANFQRNKLEFLQGKAALPDGKSRSSCPSRCRSLLVRAAEVCLLGEVCVASQ
jgi:hypothetical protein